MMPMNSASSTVSSVGKRTGVADADQTIEDTVARSPGTCMTMGTAATMMSLAEVLGPSIELADGYPMDAETADRIRTFLERDIPALGIRIALNYIIYSMTH